MRLKVDKREEFKKNCTKFKISEFRKEMKETDWEELYGEGNISVAVDIFTIKIKTSLDKYAPTKTTEYRRNHAEWLSEETKEEMKERDLSIAEFGRTGEGYEKYLKKK